MALEALNQQDQLDARFARSLAPLERMGEIPVTIAQLNLARAKEERDRAARNFEAIQEQQFRTAESKAYREYARETMLEQQAGIDTRNEKLAKLAETKDREERKINTATYRQFLKQRGELNQKIGELSEVPLAYRNRIARQLAESVNPDAKTLDQYFGLDSAADNSANFGKLKGGELLDGLYQKQLFAYQLPRNEEAKRLQMQANEITELM